MEEKIKIYLIIIFLFLPSVFYGEDTWLNNGKDIVQDSENIKAKDGFGAQLWLINPGDFFEKWNTPETPKLEVTKRARRNVPISTVILFVNPGVNNKSKCDIIYNILIKKPDGEVYANFKDVEVWQNKPAPLKNTIQLAAQNIGIMIENKDPLGKYTVDVLVKDRVKNVELPLHQEFIAE